MTTVRSLHLVSRPEGHPKDSDFEMRDTVAVPLQDGDIRIAVKYLSIDPAMRVWMTEAKSYWPPVPLGDVMRSAGIGEVVESKNPKFNVGSWVSGMTGVRSELVSDGKGMQRFDASRLPHPGWALSIFGATGLTAYFGLTDIGHPKEGEVLVVSAAAGAVGSAVVQIGKALGLKVIGLAGGPDKCAFVKDTLGADACIDYKSENLSAALREHCPDGVDIYFDNVGGDILDAVLKRLRLKARIVLCGGISQYNAGGETRGPANYLSLISARGRMEGFVVIDYLHRAEEAIAAMAPWVAAGKLTSKLDVVEGLENFPEALRRLYTGANFGKQLVQV
ncbi:MAG: NADP-dependent oxidoreductase [Gammaproteobacteria bacterium RIFCSPHIGHO2_12_FULL_63_22]|nr:MAG: NADP-dependent oxidoreductase [Gammaproteobacteria bacterium RIFCSPHIGHO2_12_FULL_63_22]